MLASWGEPEVRYHHAVAKYSACRLTISVQCAVNRI